MQYCIINYSHHALDPRTYLIVENLYPLTNVFPFIPTTQKNLSVCVYLYKHLYTYKMILLRNNTKKIKIKGLQMILKHADYLSVLVVCQNNLLIKTNIIATLWHKTICNFTICNDIREWLFCLFLKHSLFHQIMEWFSVNGKLFKFVVKTSHHLHDCTLRKHIWLIILKAGQCQ